MLYGDGRSRSYDAWIRLHGTPQERDELMTSLPSFPVGTAWVWSPGWLDVFQRVQIRRKETFDSSATPKVGTVRREKTLAPVDLERLRTRLAGTMEKMNADDPRELRRRIAELERVNKPQVIVEGVEVPVLQPQHIKTLQELVAGLRAVADELSVALAKSHPQTPAPVERAQLPPSKAPPTSSRHTLVRHEESPAVLNSGGPQLRSGARRMLQTLEQRYPTKVTRAQPGTLAGFTPSGGTFGTHFASLKRQGLITEAPSGDVQMTKAGLAIWAAMCHRNRRQRRRR